MKKRNFPVLTKILENLYPPMWAWQLPAKRLFCGDSDINKYDIFMLCTEMCQDSLKE